MEKKTLIRLKRPFLICYPFTTISIIAELCKWTTNKQQNWKKKKKVKKIWTINSKNVWYLWNESFHLVSVLHIMKETTHIHSLTQCQYSIANYRVNTELNFNVSLLLLLRSYCHLISSFFYGILLLLLLLLN